MTAAVHAYLDIDDIIFPELSKDAFQLDGEAVLAMAKNATPETTEMVPNSTHEDCVCDCDGGANEMAAGRDVDFDLGFGATLILAALITGAIWLFMRFRNKN